MIYVILFVALAIVAIFDLIKDEPIIRRCAFFSFIGIFIFISSIRWKTGPDWASYFAFYRDIELYTKGTLAAFNFMEPGYTFLSLSASNLGFTFTGFLTLLAFLTIGLKAVVIFRHKAILLISLFLYYCYFLGDIASVRQFTAISITLLSSIFIVDRKPVFFVMLVVLATTIHFSCALFLLAYWIYHRSLSSKLLYGCLVAALILGLLDVSDNAIALVFRFVGVDSDVGIKLLRYQEQGMSSVPNPVRVFLLGVLKRAIVIPIFIEGRRLIAEEFKERYSGYVNLLVFGNVIYFIFSLSIPVIQRLAVPFLFFEIFLWGFVLVSITDFKLKMVSYSLIVVFGALRLFLFMQPYWNLYFPFKTIFG